MAKETKHPHLENPDRTLHFMRGGDLSEEDSAEVLAGSGKQMRHIKFTSIKEVAEKEKSVMELIKKAAEINEA